jgi:hypothetical protein
VSAAADRAFEKLAEECTQKAGLVPCTASEYRAGLEHIIGDLKVAILASKEMDTEPEGEDDGD